MEEVEGGITRVVEEIAPTTTTNTNTNTNNRFNFKVRVDSEHKSTELKLVSASKPHMRAFHLSYIIFFACFVSTFAAAPLVAIIRDDLNLTSAQIGNAGVASVSGAVAARVAMGAACDLVGPRLAAASLAAATAPAVVLTGLATGPVSFLLARFFAGFSLATFVSTQFWMSCMFSGNVVGAANGIAAGWGNLGGGATQLLMPLVFGLIRDTTGLTSFSAWRVSFFVPATFQILMAIAVAAFGQDTPNGDFSEIRKSGERSEDKIWWVLWHGFKNYRGWILALTYGYCFGVELAVDNIIAEYFYDRFDLNIQTAGIIAASFGLANIVSRPMGGILSDKLGKRYGMRGRLWGLWTVQTIGGLLCVLLGRVDSLTASVLVMLFFSFFVQAACGLTFGVVPFVSRRSLGVISGMTGGGGNVGAVVTQVLLFRGSKMTKETGITIMGMMIIVFTLPISLIYFPQWGGMFHAPRSSATEEDYYASEWNAREKEKGLHIPAMKFARNSRFERGVTFVSVENNRTTLTSTHTRSLD